MNYDYDDAVKIIDFMKNIIPDIPEIAIVSGSGLGDIIEIVNQKKVTNTKEIPGWPRPTAPGHEGKIITGKIHDKNIIILQGRSHYYEGCSMKAVTFPIRISAMLGVKIFIATNASGGVNKNFNSGDVIAVRDHINFMGTNPLIGQNEPRWNVRFPDMTNAYDKKILRILQNMGLKTGVYAAFTGPSFETPAEIKMLEFLGVDLVGMSTVPEVIVANSMGIRVCALSCVANAAAGINPENILTEQEVLENMKKSSQKLAKIIEELIFNLKQE